MAEHIDDIHKLGALLADSEFTTIWVCQGPPRCDLEGDDAIAAQKANCPFCKQIRIDEDGAEVIVEPGTA